VPIGCEREAFVDRSPPDEEPQGEVKFAGSQPKNAFHLEEGNVLARTAFSTAGPANSQIEIRDFQFPPHVRTRLGALPGPGVIEVYSGRGAFAMAGTTQELAGGVVKGVPAGQALEFDNTGDYSLVVRVYVVEGK
jgi:quercetin dioxygenase-like cupin family protein